MDTSESPLTPQSLNNMKQLTIAINNHQSKANPIHNLVSPQGSELSQNSQSFYTKPTSCITQKEVNQAINDLTKNIKEGKYHRAILRMHKLLNPNSSISLSPFQQIKLYRRYFECMRKLSKRYFSQVGVTKSQLSNIEKMCERGTDLIDNWNNILNDLITHKNEIMLEQQDDIEENLQTLYSERTMNTFSIISSSRNIDFLLHQQQQQSQQQQSQHEKRSSQNLSEPTNNLLVSQRKSSLNKIKEVDDEESDANSIRSIRNTDTSPANKRTPQEDLERKMERQQNKKILNRIDVHLKEFFQANFQLALLWVQFAKKTENYSLLQASIFKAIQWIQKLEPTKDEDLINTFAQTYIEVGNYYLQQGVMKEAVNNYEKALSYLQKEMLIRGSSEKHQKLLKMSSKQKKREQEKLQHNILMMVCLLHSISLSEELQENYSRVLETLNLAEWMASIYLNGYSEIEGLIYKANDQAKGKYKDIVEEEGEIHIIMDEALGIKEEKRKTNIMNKTENDDFYTYYSNLLYDKYNIKELNESLYITVPKQQQTPAQSMVNSALSELHLATTSSFVHNQPAVFTHNQPVNLLAMQQQQVKVSTFHNSNFSNGNINNTTNNTTTITNNNNMNTTSLRSKKNLSIPASFNSTNMLGSTTNYSNSNIKQSVLEETPTKYKVDAQLNGGQKIRQFNSTTNKRNNTTMSLLNNTYTPQHRSSQSMITPMHSSAKFQRSSISHIHANPHMNATTTNFSPFQQYQFVPFDSQPKQQSEINITKSEILKNIDMTFTPNHQRDRVHMGPRSMTAIGLVSTPSAQRASTAKQDTSKRSTPQPIQPRILTTDKYFNESSMIYYSTMSKDIFQDKQQTDEEKKQQVRNKYLQQPQVIQNLDIYFKDKIYEEFQKLNSHDQTNIEYEMVTKGIKRVMKDEYFDKDEFQNAQKLLKLKKQTKLFKYGEEVFNKQDPPEIKITTHTQIKNEIYHQEAQQNIKQEITNKKAAQKEMENQRMAKNLIQEDYTDNSRKRSLGKILSQNRNSLGNLKNVRESILKSDVTGDGMGSQSAVIKKIYMRDEMDKHQGINPQAMAKKVINLEIESIDNQMKREDKEIVDLMNPKDRRPVSELKMREEISTPHINSQQSLSPSHNKNMSSVNQSMRSISRNRRLKFLDNYQDISKSTQLISVKRDVKKATTLVDLAFGSYKLQKQGMDRNKLSSTENQKQTSQNGKIPTSLQKSLRKLMKLKTSDLQEGQTPHSHRSSKVEEQQFIKQV